MTLPADIVIRPESVSSSPALSPATPSGSRAVEEATGLACALEVVLNAEKRQFQKAAAALREQRTKGERISVIAPFIPFTPRS